MEKIRITSEDIGRVDGPAPSSSAPSPFATRAPRRWSPWLIAGGAGLAGCIVLIVVICLAVNREPPMNEWLGSQRNQLNAKFAASPDLKPYIERIHPLVTYTGATVKSISATTVDGSQRIGPHAKNIAELEYVVTFHWQGPVQTNGYTEVDYTWDMQANQLKKTRYLDTNALVNLDNIDWFKVGVQLAPFFFGGN